MSQWTSLSLILTLGLILLGLSAEAAAAADDLPRNIELKPGLFGHFAKVDVTELAPEPGHPQCAADAPCAFAPRPIETLALDPCAAPGRGYCPQPRHPGWRR